MAEVVQLILMLVQIVIHLATVLYVQLKNVFYATKEFVLQMNMWFKTTVHASLALMTLVQLVLNAKLVVVQNALVAIL